MYIKQRDLLSALEKPFVKSIMKVAEKQSHPESTVLFREGDTADHLYMLVKGHVRLAIGEIGHSIYIINHPGEIFGWSSIIGRKTYTATAICVKESQLYRLERRALNDLLESDPKNGMIFFKKISEALGNRLLHIYELATPASIVITHGTRQVEQYPEAV